MRRWMMWGGAACLVLGTIGSTSAKTQQESCCFTNPGFTGVCRVEPGEDETCSSVLQYLNTPNSQGRTYCGGSNIRGGWKSVTCEEP